MEEENKTPENNQPQNEGTTPSQAEAQNMEQVTDPAPVIEKSPMQKDLEELNHAVMKIRKEIGKIIVGQDDTLELLMIGMLSGGHILLEGVPGIAKTLTAKLLSKTLSVDFSRIQFTPDMMPTDVIGTNVFNVKTSDFEFKSGPIFSNIVLIDEINRAPAKTQSALFEVMQEQQITLDGTEYKMEYPFFVIATQNPVEQEGTYKLPEAQLDRFLFRINMSYPSLQEETDILMRFKNDTVSTKEVDLDAVLSVSQMKQLQETISKVHVKDELVNYIAQMVHETRNNASLFLGASPRASLAILYTAKTAAAMAGRDFVTPDDIRKVTVPVLNHRIILSPDREMEGVEIEEVIDEIIEKIEVPR